MAHSAGRLVVRPYTATARGRYRGCTPWTAPSRHTHFPIHTRSLPMVKKIQKSGSDTKAASAGPNSPLSGAIKDSAQQIWLAGLGAFSKAQEEGGKAFESLVKEGLSIQRKTQAVAEERISEATSRVSTMATDISSK